jgi:hypothetical protein
VIGSHVGLTTRQLAALRDGRPDERRADAVEQPPAPPLGLREAEGERAQVVLGDDVDDDRDATARAVQGVRDRGGPAADGPQVEHEHVARGVPAAGLLLHVLGQVGPGEAERGVVGELGLGDRGERAAPAAHVVGAPDRDPPGVRERRDDHDAVGGRAGRARELVGDHLRFEREVPAQRGVAAADEPERAPVRGGQGVRHDLAVARRRLLGVEAAGVGQHVHRRSAPGERPGEVLDGPAGQHRQAGDRLGAGRVVVEHDQRAAGRRDGGRHLARGDRDLRRVAGEQLGLEHGHSSTRSAGRR